MRTWFLVGALILGLIGMWGELDRGGRGRGRGTAPETVEDASPLRAMDGGSTIPTPRH